jgi:hypothetical protein
MDFEVEKERRLIQDRRRRGMILKLVREGHVAQLPRLDDFELWATMQRLGQTIGRDHVVTLLQDLQTLDYVSFETTTNEWNARVELGKIMLTANGLRAVTMRRSNEDVLFS